VYSLSLGFYSDEFFFKSEPINQVFEKKRKNLASVIVAQFSETFTRPLMDIRKNSNTRGDYCNTFLGSI
jgi:hypothetical protein